MTGAFRIEPPLAPAHREYLLQFAQTRRMRRDCQAAAERADPLRELVGLPVGEEGGFFVGGCSDPVREAQAADVVDPEEPPAGQPSLECPWLPSEDGSRLLWRGLPGATAYLAWLEYLSETFLARWGYGLRGEVHWKGTFSCDRGSIRARGRVLVVQADTLVYAEAAS